MSILDWLRRLHEESEQAAFEPIEEETYVNGEKVPEGEIVTEGEGEGDALPTLRKGSKGDDVCLLQTTLNEQGYDCGTPDGIFGKKTQAAVKAFQKAKGLKVDGIVGRKTWTALGLMEPEPEPTFIQPPDFKQYDSRWAKKMYSSHGDKKQTMRSSGCGPTAMADIVAEWWDKDATPWTLAQKSLEWGTRTYDSGTSSTFFRKCHEYYGGKYQTSSSMDTLKQCLREGGYVVACMGKGYWTSGGHYICVWKYDDDYIYANDPASSSRKRQKTADFQKQRKGYYCFWR